MRLQTGVGLPAVRCAADRPRALKKISCGCEGFLARTVILELSQVLEIAVSSGLLITERLAEEQQTCAQIRRLAS
jgi:hypothetical protein